MEREVLVSNDNLISGLMDIVRSGNLIYSEEQLREYSVDGLVPEVVLYPEDEDELSSIISFAKENHLYIIPRGGGSKLHIGNVPTGLDMVICTEGFNRIIDLDSKNLTLIVQSGARIWDVQDVLSSEGLMIPVSPPHIKRCTLGGMLSSNSNGYNRLSNGSIRDMVLGIRYVGADAKVKGFGAKTVKNVSGYDMPKLFIGSFGTLGVITGCIIRLIPLKEAGNTIILPMKDIPCIEGFLKEILNRGLIPTGIELLDQNLCSFLNKIPLQHNIPYYLSVAIEGLREEVERLKREVKDIFIKISKGELIIIDGDEHKDFWIAYSEIEDRLLSDPKEIFTIKLCFLTSDLTLVLNHILNLKYKDALLQSSPLNGIMKLHIPAGSNDKNKILNIDNILSSLSGDIIFERLPLELKKGLNIWRHRREDIRIMKRIKEFFDPQDIFSPGRLV